MKYQSDKDSNVARSPEYMKKLDKLESLKTELAGLIAERDKLENTVSKNLEAIYATKIGINEYKLFESECEIARLKRKIELFQAKLNHGEKPDILEIESKLDEEYKKWEKEMSKMLKDIENSRKRLGSLMSDKDSKELQSNYRFLVKKLHPDVNLEQTERTKLLWNRTMEAYARNDLEELKAIKLLIDEIDDSDIDYSGPDIDDRITLVGDKVFTLLEYIKKIKSISVRCSH